MQNVATAPWRCRISRILGVQRGSGPSSKVSATVWLSASLLRSAARGTTGAGATSWTWMGGGAGAASGASDRCRDRHLGHPERRKQWDDQTEGQHGQVDARKLAAPEGGNPPPTGTGALEHVPPPGTDRRCRLLPTGSSAHDRATRRRVVLTPATVRSRDTQRGGGDGSRVGHRAGGRAGAARRGVERRARRAAGGGAGGDRGGGGGRGRAGRADRRRRPGVGGRDCSPRCAASGGGWTCWSTTRARSARSAGSTRSRSRSGCRRSRST